MIERKEEKSSNKQEFGRKFILLMNMYKYIINNITKRKSYTLFTLKNNQLFAIERVTSIEHCPLNFRWY